MDSVTQLVLGAAVGEATLGRKVGRKAMAWGAVCGTLPDLDVVVPLGDAVRDFTYHRGPSHSLFVLAAVTPLVVWLIRRIHPAAANFRKQWYLLVYLVFATHVLLDSFTVYGTQIFWPLFTTPMTWSTIFVIDPAYTLPLLIGITAAAVAGRRRSWGRRMNAIGLTLSTAYLAWSLGAKLYVEDLAGESLAFQGIDATSVLTTPTPFNTLLWRVLAMSDERYFEGFYSLLDGDRPIRFNAYPKRSELLDGLEDAWAVRRLQWFTKGFYRVERAGNDVLMTDLRMGLEPDYVFSFKIGEIANPHPVATGPERISVPRRLDVLGWVWRRATSIGAGPWAVVAGSVPEREPDDSGHRWRH